MEYKKFIYNTAYTTIFISLIVTIGWLADIGLFKTMIPGYVSMKFNAALCFLLLGISLRIIDVHKSTIVFNLLIISTLIICSLTVFQEIFGHDLGVDNFFINDLLKQESIGSNPGRMALPTAFCFVLLGIGLYFNRMPRLVSISQILFHLVTLIAFVAITGYILKVPALYKLSLFTSMAVHTAGLLLLFSVAAALLRPVSGLSYLFTQNNIGSTMARNLFPRMVFTLLILAGIRIALHRYNLVDTEYGIALFAISFAIVGLFLIYNAAKALNKSDQERANAEKEQLFVNQNLEEIVRQRTSELERALNKLKNTSELNQIFIQQAPNAIAMFDIEMRYLAASQKWLEDYNLLGKDVIGNSHYDIFPEINNEWKAIHQRCLKGEVNREDEVEFVRKDGSTQWIAWDVRPWFIEKDEIGGLLMYTSDITAYKLRESEKRRVEDILDKTSEVARIGTWEIDLKTNKLSWSRMTREIHELPSDYQPELESAIDFFKEGESRDLIENAVQKAITCGTPYDIELELVTLTGKAIWARAIGQAEFHEGTCKRLYGVFQDIDEIKRSKEALSKLSGELQAIFNSAYVSIIGTDLDGTITSFNKGAELLLHYSASEMVNKNTPAMIHLEEEVIERGIELTINTGRKIEGFEAFIEVPKTNGFEAREWTYVRKDGTTFPVQLVVTAIKDGRGEINGFLGIATDISDLKEARISLEVLTEKLQQKNNQLLNFAHITSHNLRSPVSNLNTVLFLHKEATDEEEKKILCGHMETVVSHLTETLNQLVDSLRVQEDKGKEKQLINLSETFEKNKEIFIGTIIETGAKVSADFTNLNEIEYPTAYLESIFLNLLSNALKYRSPDRIPEIKFISFLTEKGPGLSVSDNGLGIDLNKHGGKIFGLNKTFHRHAEAKGVGLFMTKTQIEAMGGSIKVESLLNEGSKFTIYFNHNN